MLIIWEVWNCTSNILGCLPLPKKKLEISTGYFSLVSVQSISCTKVTVIHRPPSASDYERLGTSEKCQNYKWNTNFHWKVWSTHKCSIFSETLFILKIFHRNKPKCHAPFIFPQEFWKCFVNGGKHPCLNTSTRGLLNSPTPPRSSPGLLPVNNTYCKYYLVRKNINKSITFYDNIW